MIQLRLDCQWTAVPLPFDHNSTALRPMDDYVTTVGLPMCGLLHSGLS